jgi:hypothetical protein
MKRIKNMTDAESDAEVSELEQRYTPQPLTFWKVVWAIVLAVLLLWFVPLVWTLLEASVS